MTITEEILCLFAEFDDYDSLFWFWEGEKISFRVNVNDVFAWGVADAEIIEDEEDLPELRKAFEESEAANGIYGAVLFVARKRKMRPQGAWMKDVSKGELALFSEVGPERETGFGNPVEWPSPEDLQD
jgi:hypothetical protein